MQIVKHERIALAISRIEDCGFPCRFEERDKSLARF
jgi:hypothetical protein